MILFPQSPPLNPLSMILCTPCTQISFPVSKFTRSMISSAALHLDSHSMILFPPKPTQHDYRPPSLSMILLPPCTQNHLKWSFLFQNHHRLILVTPSKPASLSIIFSSIQDSHRMIPSTPTQISSAWFSLPSAPLRPPQHDLSTLLPPAGSNNMILCLTQIHWTWSAPPLAQTTQHDPIYECYHKIKEASIMLNFNSFVSRGISLETMTIMFPPFSWLNWLRETF